MDFKINVEFDNNKTIFYLSLPVDLSNINSDAFIEATNKTLYVEKKRNIDFNKLYRKLISEISTLEQDFKIKIDYKKIKFNLNTQYTSLEEVARFINENPNIKIILYTNDTAGLIKLLGNSKKNNLKIRIKNSDESVSYEELYNIYKKMDEIISFIKRFNLSPLEQIMLTYDIVKSNKYQKEDQNDDYGISRNINRILYNDKLVCVGFSNLINYILTNLGIKCEQVRFKHFDSKSGHQRDLVYINDKKYKINGAFMLDSTWDSRRNNNYIDNYNYFLKPLIYFKLIRNDDIYKDKTLKFIYRNYEEAAVDIEESDIVKKTEIAFYIKKLEKFIDSDDKSSSEIDNILLAEKDDLKERLRDIYIKYNRKLSKSAFMRALYKVRRIEYINNMISFCPNEEYINEVADRYYKEGTQDRILKALGLYEEATLDSVLDEICATSIKEDTLRIRLLKELKEKLQDFPKNDMILKMRKKM